MLKIYNTLTKEKQSFKPIEPGKVGLYVCGITVYDFCHVGHARVYVTFDVIIRFLRANGFDVNYVRNITDIDDKIICRALESGEDMRAITDRFITAMHEDLTALYCLPPTKEPRATEHIDEIITLIQTLIDKDFAYQGKDGDVYYKVKNFKDYGALAHKDIEHLRIGTRVEVAEDKHDPLDFVLWKRPKPGEPEWPSPWGGGRPGWHIECSAMSINCLGPTFDIHGGGSDLQFPHHENERAQSEGATGERFVNNWMHIGFVNIDDEKMSKSLGNFFTIREVLEQYTPEVVRYFLIASHYRSPVNYSLEQLDNAQHALQRFYLSLRGLDIGEIPEQPTGIGGFAKRFNETMEDDFNTPEALAVLFDLVKEINRVRQEDDTKAIPLAQELKCLSNILGILQNDAERFLKGKPSEPKMPHGFAGHKTKIASAEIEALILARDKARESQDWVRADEIRDTLLSKGVVLEDTSGGTSWRQKS